MKKILTILTFVVVASCTSTTTNTTTDSTVVKHDSVTVIIDSVIIDSVHSEKK